MMTCCRPWFPVVLGLLGVGVYGGGLLPGGYLAPVTGPHTSVPVGEEIPLRRPQVVHMVVDSDEKLDLEVACLPVGRYLDALSYEIRNPAGDLLTSGQVPLGERNRIQIPDTPPGEYLLRLDAGLNASSVRSPLRHRVYEASENTPLKMIYHAPVLYFWVPPDAETVAVTLAGSGSQEAASFEIRSPGGQRLASGDTQTSGGHAELSVAKEDAGAAWSIAIGPLEGTTFEDFSLIVGGDAPPFVAESPDALLVPVMHVYARFSGTDVDLGMRVNADSAMLGDCSLELSIQDNLNGQSLVDRIVSPVIPGYHGCLLPGRAFLNVTVLGKLRTSQGNLLIERQKRVAAAHGQLFEEIPNVEDHPAAVPLAADTRRGYQVFVRAEPGDIRPDSHPRAEEIVNTVQAVVTPGEFETLYFALYPLQDAASASVSVGGFEDASGRVQPGVRADLRWVTCWPQRTDWRSSTFHVIPELLEHHDSQPLQRGVARQFAVIVAIPDDTPAGRLEAPVRISTGETEDVPLRLCLDVQPFRLRTPQGIVWGLYPDTGRWRNFTDSEIEAEMQDFLAHGITALMMYPQAAAKWSFADGRLAADFSEFRRRMALYRKVGLGEPMVMSIQGAEGVVKRVAREQDLSGDGARAGLYRELLALLRQESTEDHWPEFCLHSVDEPHGGETLAAALRTLTMIKEMGFKTFNTCYGDAVRETLDPCLDYRCYNNIGFLSFPNEDATRKLREETLAAGDTFWWYGTGCYTNGNLIQDGNVIVNRFMGGFHFWRTGATGCWAWTFLRPKGDAFDDFDGGEQRECKDACIAYPGRDGHGLITTLQWEGIREGVDDYKYIYTLSELIREGRASEAREQQVRAESAAKELESMLAEMPWTCRKGAFTNGDATRVREWIAYLCAGLCRP